MKKNDGTGERIAYNLTEAAQTLGISMPLMTALVNSDGFPAIRVVKRWVIPAKPLEVWLSNAANAQRVFKN